LPALGYFLIHCLITEGGLKNGQWVSTKKKGYLLPVRAVMAVFRGKLLWYIDKAAEKGELKLPEGLTLQRWKNLKNKLGRVKWNVHVREKYEYGKGILIYLSRYIRGGAISNKRIVSHTGKGVTFRLRASDASKQNIMTLQESDFIQRYLLHVPEPNMKVVRSYGLYASTAKEKLSYCRSLFGQEAVRDIESSDWQDYCETKGNEHPELCPICGQKLIRDLEIPPMRVYRPPANKVELTRYREAIQKAA